MVLRQERRARGLTLDGLKAKTGIDATSLSDYENGKAVPDHATLVRIIQGMEAAAEPILATLYPVGEVERDWDSALVAKLIGEGVSEDEAVATVQAVRLLLSRRAA